MPWSIPRRKHHNDLSPESASMMKQRPFTSLSFESRNKPTRAEGFPGEIDKVVPSAALLAWMAK
jgi:hypothetical protein